MSEAEIRPLHRRTPSAAVAELDAPPPDAYDDHQPPPRADQADPLTDPVAERAVLGAMLDPAHGTTALDAATTHLTGPDFASPRHELIYDAAVALYSRAQPVDPLAVADHLGPDLPKAGGLSYLFTLVEDAIHVADAGYHARTVADRATRRRLDATGIHLRQLARGHATGDLDQLLHAAGTALADVPRTIPGVDRDMPGQTIAALLAGDDPEYDWLIPGFLERRDRFILTGAEGAGKTTLLRQIAVQAASGIHPWTLEHVAPIRVLVVDLENSDRQNRREYRPLTIAAGIRTPEAVAGGYATGRLDPDRLIIHSKLDGIDLTHRPDETWLDQLVSHHRPDLLVTGPIYKLAGGNPNDEVDAKPAAMALDRIRERHGCALLLEAHSKKGENPKTRPKEPFGWSGWLRWPEFGFHIAAEGDFTPWRGQRDATRTVPLYLRRGGPWPWSPAISIAEQQWAAIRQIAMAAGERLTGRQMADRLDMSEATYRRRITGHELELEQIWRRIEGEM